MSNQNQGATTSTTTTAVPIDVIIAEQLEQVDKLRVSIDAVLQAVTDTRLDNGRPALTLVAVESGLIMGKAWLGKLKGELGAGSPYSEGKKTVADIEPTAETAESPARVEGTYIEQLSGYRDAIQAIIDEVQAMDVRVSRDAAASRTNAWTKLCEAKMAVGFEFSRLRG